MVVSVHQMMTRYFFIRNSFCLVFFLLICLLQLLLLLLLLRLFWFDGNYQIRQIMAIIHISFVCADGSRWINMHSIHATCSHNHEKALHIGRTMEEFVNGQRVADCRMSNGLWLSTAMLCASVNVFVGRSNSYSENYYVIFSNIMFRIFL